MASKEHKRRWPFLLVGLVLVIALAAVLLWDALIAPPKTPVSRSDFAMGTVVTQRLFGKDLEATEQAIFDRITVLDKNRLSWRETGSDIYNLNGAAGGEPLQVAPETDNWLRRSIELCKDSGGALDLTVLPLTKLWGIGTPEAAIPETAALEAARELVNYESLKMNGSLFSLPEMGQGLDLGAVGKGIACDVARELLEGSQAKFQGGTVAVGGSVLVYGKPEKGKYFKIGIRDPRGSQDELVGTLSITGGVLSTSGDYEQYFEQNGKRYHHILDPRTGMPADTGLMSVTVVCESGLVSDALSTACFVLGYQNSLPLLQEYQAEAIFIDTEKQIYITSGLKDRFQLVKTQIGYALAQE